MEALKRNETTAEEASKVEDAVAHPLCPGKQHSPEYFEILKIRRKLPISAKRQEFLDAYHSSKVSFLHITSLTLPSSFSLRFLPSV